MGIDVVMTRGASIIKLIIVLLLSGVVGMLLLVLANLLPSDRIKSHIADGAFVILQESAEFEYAEGYPSAILDNYTDSVILSKTAWPSEYPIEDAVNAPSYAWPGQSAEDMEIFGYLNDNSLEDARIDIYPRYWHGYQVILRPLFTIFGYADIRILNQMVQMVLLVAVLYGMFQCGLNRYLVPFTAMILMWNPATMGVSLQYSPCYYISMITALVILVASRYRNGGDMAQTGLETATERLWFRECLLFMMAGVMTAYLDFLTYPLATLGVPLVFLLLTRNDSTGDKNTRGMVISCIGIIVRLSICWAVGYLGMWMEKWIYGSILTGTNIMADAANAVATRTSSDNGEMTISRIGTILYLIKRTFGNWGGVVLVVVAAAVITAIVISRTGCHHGVIDQEDERGVLGGYAVAIALILIGIMPFVWYYLTANHSYIHPRLVYRSLGITVFAWLSAWSILLERLIRERQQ